MINLVMVGVPRSTGCRLCRTRKVKCDTLKPSCGNCIKYGAECPGYSRGLKFVDEKHQIRQRGRRQGKGEEVSTSSSSSTTGSDIATSDSETWSLVRPSPTLLRLELPRGPLLLNMIESSTNYTRSTDVFILLSWLNIDRLGKRALLDGAICSFALHLTGKANSNADLVAKSRSIYGLALNELQAALQHSTEWKASETLCAAILLCYFEVFLLPLFFIQSLRPIAVCWDNCTRYLDPTCQRHWNSNGAARTSSSRRRLGRSYAALMPWYSCMSHVSP